MKVPRQMKLPPLATVKLPPLSMTMLLLRILLCSVPFTFVLPETVRLELDTIFPPVNKFPAILAPPNNIRAPVPSCVVSVLSVKIILATVN